jgi:ssDNA-specific exonuclease RecJ
MTLPNSYTVKPNSIAPYFDAILNAQPPERFSTRFLEKLGFSSTNDRPFIGILKELGFLNADGLPQQRYYDFLDRTRSRQVLADGIRDAFSDLFAVNIKANEFTPDDVKNKLRSLYKGTKTDSVIDRIAKTFSELCEEGHG